MKLSKILIGLCDIVTATCLLPKINVIASITEFHKLFFDRAQVRDIEIFRGPPLGLFLVANQCNNMRQDTFCVFTIFAETHTLGNADLSYSCFIRFLLIGVRNLKHP